MAGALDSLKILDFSTLLPGPYATMMLADMGADVLRVESPTRLDLVRVLPPMVDRKTSAAHAYLNRGKRSLALNLKAEGAKEIIYKLVEQYDIVIEQFRPGVMDKLGIGYDTLKAINPKLIYCAITGYGQTGPYRDRAGHDLNYLSLSGVANYSRRQGERPCPLGIQVADVAGGSHHAVMGILAAAVHRLKTGEGQFLDISMTDAAFALNAMSAAGMLVSGDEPEPEGEVLNGGGFYDYYETSDGRYFSVASLEPQFMKGLCEALGKPDWVMIGMSQKPSDQFQFRQQLSQLFKTHDFAYWKTFFAELDVCVEPVLSLSEAAQHPLLQERKMVTEVPVPDTGKRIQQPGFPIKFSVSPCSVSESGSDLGAHTQSVLSELGFSPEQVADLKQRKVFG